MKLFEIISNHYSPKDCHSSTMDYVLAEDENQVYDFIKDKYGWIGDEDELYWDEETKEETATHRESVIKNQGELEEEQYLNDLYYGVTLYGWEIIAEDVDIKDFQKSIELGIIRIYETNQFQ